MKIDDQLNTILGSLRPLRMTFGKFIVACLTSKDKRITRLMKNFYENEGPAELMNIWQVQVHKENDVRSMLGAATDLIVKHCSIELRDASEDPKLRLSAKSVTSGAANSFKLKTARRSFERNAPTLTRLLIGLATINDSPTRCPEAIVTMICSMLLIVCSQKANYLQMVMGLYLFSKGAPRQLMGVLCKAGMSVSHQTVLRSIQSLTTEEKAVAKNAATTKSWYLIHDNINMAFRKYDQRLDNQDSFESGTAATLVIQEEFNNLGYKPGPINLQLSDLLPNEGNEQHLRSVIRHHLVGVLRRRPRQSLYHPCMSTNLPFKESKK
ncbi:hypothetical protein BGZ93_002591 [Podila epicladia]|nr:hypothetical protein BGZ93_002591 [Podila epicladia]